MKKQHIILKSEERETLKQLLSGGQQPVKVYRRALALQELDRSKSYKDVAAIVGVSTQTVSDWVKNYQKEGLTCLYDKPRPGRPIVFDGELRAKLTALACSSPPDGYGQWSLRLLADKAVELEYCESISHTEVSKILKKTNCNRT